MFNDKVKLKLPKSLAKHKALESFPAHAVVGTPDEMLSKLYCIEEGFIKLYSVAANGKKMVHLFYGIGDYFSIPQLVYNVPLGLYYETIEATIVAAYPGKLVQKAMHEDAGFSFSIVKYAVAQAVYFKYQKDNLSFNFASERIAFRLLLLMSKYGIRKDGLLLLPAFTQEDLANTISLSRESMSKGLKRLERLGVISYLDGRVGIVDAEFLLKELGGIENLPPNFSSLPELTINR